MDMICLLIKQSYHGKFGINKNLYKKELSIHFKKFLRNEKKFKNINELKKQIKIDITKAKFI